ncbi:MAG: type B 50S ribosomal protein L31 [Blastochloris sp.]|jgi:large subunit ribosomal protein L31|nr:type B 50S ribosomal protein L31 [Blastochloris sp.]
MKKDIHPTLHPVVFVDAASGVRYVTRSTKTSDESENIDGKPHHVIALGISAASHPFFTGQKTFVDTAGRVDKFKKRFGSVKMSETTRPVPKKK